MPLLLIGALPGQEAGNAEYVIANGAGELAKDPLAVLEIMCHWLADNGRLLVEKSRNARRMTWPTWRWRQPVAAHTLKGTIASLGGSSCSSYLTGVAWPVKSLLAKVDQALK